MPYDISIARVDEPITKAEFDAAFDEAPTTWIPAESALRVRHPADGDPWFTARLSDGAIVCSTSYSSVEFVTNMPDMVEAALELAGELGATVSAADGTEVTDDGIDELLDPAGPYMAGQLASWTAAMRRVDDGEYPLDFPVDGREFTTPYLAFTVPLGSVGVGELLASEALSSFTAAPDPDEADTYLVRPKDADEDYTIVTTRGTAAIVWPDFNEPVPTVGPATIDVATALAAAANSDARLLNRDTSASTMATARELSAASGTALAEWVAELP